MDEKKAEYDDKCRHLSKKEQKKPIIYMFEAGQNGYVIFLKTNFLMNPL